MSMKKLLLLTLTLSTLYPPLAGLAQDKWDLRRCVDYAIANNISVKQADVQARLAKLTLQQSEWTQIPTLIVGTNLGINSGNSLNQTTYTINNQTSFFNSYSAQSSVTLFNFRYVRNLVAANRLSWQAALTNSDKAKNDITLNVANAYLQVLLSIDQTELALGQLHLSQNQLEITRKQVTAGTLPELNAAELEAQVAQDSASYINTRGTIQLNVLQLKAYMGMDMSVPFEVYTPPVEEIPVENIADLQPESVYALAIVNYPLQKMDALQIAAARKNVAATKGAQYPSVSLFGNVSTNFIGIKHPAYDLSPYVPVKIGNVGGTNTPVYDTVQVPYNVRQELTPYFKQLQSYLAEQVGISVNIPILNQRIYRTQFEKAKLNLRNQELQRDQDNLTLKQNIYQAYTAAITALQKFEANKISVAATQKSYDFAQKRRDVGMLNTIDLLTNLNNLNNARINLISSQFDYVFKMKVLEYYKGLGVKLSK